ncbi:SHOCT domain-containing protein [Kitasatospora phosalacinea]|uniref:SHOCT domain-containing protein n=1 Tax=Kitasatospora phosalacinea TaxID=2065 RepID=UPI001AE08A8D|nr:SHOCT domain-containing protein [Kitasatospora phosalacinea]
MYWHDHEGMNGWGVGLMALITLLVLGLLVAAAVVLLRYLGHSGGQHPAQRRPEPEQVLADRLARGEIDPDEYRQRLDALRGTTGKGGAGWAP